MGGEEGRRAGLFIENFRIQALFGHLQQAFLLFLQIYLRQLIALSERGAESLLELRTAALELPEGFSYLLHQALVLAQQVFLPEFVLNADLLWFIGV